jgi:chemotaxis protein CheX
MTMSPETMQPFIVETKDVPNGTFEVSAVIGLSGSWAGTLVLSCPQEVAGRIISRMVHEPVEALDADISDGMGELVNIMAGNACQHLSERGGQFVYLSIPTVVMGRHRIVWRSRDLPCLVMRFFDSDLGPLCIELNLHATANGSKDTP